jgi:sugar lactone lactonase YvrE
VQRRPTVSTRKLFVEPLEDRVVPATVNWVNAAGGDWDTPSNWSTGQLPQPGDLAMIPSVNGPITHSQAVNDSVGAIVSSTNIVLSGGALTTGTLTTSNNVALLLEGGTLANAMITPSSTVDLTNAGGVLTQVTVAAGATIDGTQMVPTGVNGPLYNNAIVEQGLILNGTLLLGATNGSTSAQLLFNDNPLLSGTGSVVLGGATNGPNGNGLFALGQGPDASTPATMTIATGITITGTDAQIGRARGTIHTIAGNGDTGFGGDGGPATTAAFTNPFGLARDAAGDLFITDDQRVREISAATGIITTVAGDGVAGFAGDGGPATAAELNFPSGVAVDAAGNIFIADAANNRIREVFAATGNIITIAGIGTAGFSGDGGKATLAQLHHPQGVAVDSAGDVFITDTLNNAIREVTAGTGIITTIAGNGAVGYSGDGGPATAAMLNNPEGPVAIDAAGDVFIADSANSVVREVAAGTQTISTVAGNGIAGFSGDGGPATAASFQFVSGVALDSAGDLFISDFNNQRIRKVNAATGIVTTIVGTGVADIAGDGGLASAADVSSPGGLVVDGAGNVYIADGGNNRIRRIEYNPDAIVNNGTIHVDSVGVVSIGGNAVSNAGIFQVDSGGTLSISAGTTFTNFGSSTLTGGTYIIGGRFQFAGAAIATDVASIELDGTSSVIADSNTGVDALTLLSAVAPGASFTLNGRSLTTTSPLTNQGAVTIASATLLVQGNSTQLAAGSGFSPSSITLVNGGALNLDALSTLTIAAGTLQGSGSILGNLRNAAVVSPGTGTTPGFIEVQGIYNQSATGALDIKLNATGQAGAAYDDLDVGGNATLDGTLNVSVAPGFVPNFGSTFNILQYASSRSTFATLTGLGVDNFVSLDEKFGSRGLVLTADPPAGTSLGLIAPILPFITAGPNPATVVASVFNPYATVNAGNVTFTVTDQAGNIVAGPVTSNTVANSSASANLVLPAGTAAGRYLVDATYNPGGGFLGNTAVSSLVVSAPTTTGLTANPTVSFSAGNQNVTLTATVNSPGDVVNEGTVFFDVFNSANVQIASVASNSINLGTAAATLVLPGGTGIGAYAIQVSYSDADTSIFQSSVNATDGTLTVVAAKTTTVAAAATAVFGLADQQVDLTATVVSAGGSVNTGTVDFSVLKGNTLIGNVVAGTPVNGLATAAYTLPAGTAAGSYTIDAVYLPGPNLGASSDVTRQLTVTPAPTAVVANNATTTFSPGQQKLTLIAVVRSGGIGINDGSVTFTVYTSHHVRVGLPVTSGPVTAGNASAVFVVPAGQTAGIYSIEADYFSNGNYQVSADTTHLVSIGKAASVTTAANSTAPFSTGSESVALKATVTSGGLGVNEGTVTFTVFQGLTQIGVGVVSGTVAGGNASTNFALPAGTPQGLYTIDAVYNPGPDLTASNDATHQLDVVFATMVTSIAPIVPLPGTALAGVAVHFNGPIKPASFTSAAVLSLLSPTGTTINPGQIVNVTPAPTPGNPTPAGVFNVLFATPQTAAGTYSISIGTSITDPLGNPLSQPFNGSVSFAPGTVPTITPGTFSQILIDPTGSHQPIGPINFSVASQHFTASQLVVTATSSNQTVLPDSDLVLSNTGPNYSLTINPPVGATSPTGAVTITLTVTEPDSLFGTASIAAIVDGPVTLPPVAAVSKTHDQFPFTEPLNASSASGNTLTYSTSLVGDSPLFDLESQFGFKGITYFTNNATTAFLLQASSNNANGNPFYLLRPSDGGLFAYAGGTYADTFANSANLVTTLGTNVYTDPSLLTNAQAPIDHVTLHNLEQQFGFVGLQYFSNGGNTAFILQASSNNANGNPFYLLRSTDGGLFAYGGGKYAATFANANNLVATLGVRVFNNPSLLTNAGAPLSLYDQLYQVNQQFDLQELNGSFFLGGGGHGAEWFFSPVLNQFGQHWYTLTLQTLNGSQEAVLTAFAGYPDSTVGTVVATLDPSVYAHPVWLSSATAIANPPAGTVSIDSSGNMTLNLPSANFLGTYQATVTTTDGLLSATRSFSVTSTDPNPSLTVQQGATTIANGSTQTFSHLNFPQTFTVTGSSTDSGDTVTVSASATSYGQLFALQQRYRFTGLQYFTNGGNTAFLLQAAGNNRNGNPIYLLRSTDGALFAYAGGTYADTFADPNNLIATPGVNVFADPTLLTNALPALDYTTLFNLEQQFHFQGLQYFTNNGVPAFILQASVNNANGNPFYLVSTTGGLYAYGGGTYAATFANSANLIANLDPQIYVTPSLLTGAQTAPGLYTQLQAVQASLDLKGLQYFVNSGIPAFLLQAPVNNANGNPIYLLLATGDLYAYGGGTFAATVANSANLVAHLDPSVYVTPTLLTGARAPLAATAAQVPVAGSTLTVNSPAAFVGTFQVTVTATDGVTSTSQTFLVTSTDTPPVPNAIPAQTASGSTVNVTLGANDAEHDPVTFSATAVGFSLPFNLEQQYKFKGVGYATSDGITAYVLSVSGDNGNGNPFYLLTANGGLFAFDGLSYATTVAGAPLAQLDAAVFTTPSLLTNAQAPTKPAVLPVVSGNMLTVNVSGLPVGFVFQILVTASDGAETGTTSFLVTV